MQNKCFVLMPFRNPFNDYFKQILVPAISMAGFTPVRADEIYGTRPVIEDIFNGIRESAALIADVTGKNPNVNYELGIAHALRRPVVIISQSVDDIPFDYRHIRAIIYDTTKFDWAQQLKSGITSTLKTVTTVGTNAHEVFVLAELNEIARNTAPRAAFLSQIYEALRASFATLYSTREEAYKAVTDAITNVSAKQQGEKHLLLVALHGHSGKRRASPSYTNKAFEDFDSEIFKCERSFGPDMWYAREIYNIVDEERLNMIVDWMEAGKDAEGYEIRAFCLQNALPQLTPLVVGSEDVFIGMDDSHYYRVRGAIHVRGQSFAKFATDYFESLWTDPRIYKLRSGYGIDYPQIETLRAALKNNSPT